MTKLGDSLLWVVRFCDGQIADNRASDISDSVRRVVEDHDGIGTAVIEATRLLKQAEPGEVVMTALAAETAPGSDLSPFEDLGMHELKGLPGHSHTVKARAPVQPQAFLTMVLAIAMAESTQLLVSRGDLGWGYGCERCSRQHLSGFVAGDFDDAFDVRATPACQPGDLAVTTANTLICLGRMTRPSGPMRRRLGCLVRRAPTEPSPAATTRFSRCSRPGSEQRMEN